MISQYLQGDHALLVSRLVGQRGVYMSMGFGFFHEGAFCLLLYYIPIYFQVVAGISPSEAGFRNLPMLISCGIGSALTGFLVSRFGYYTPFMVWASAGGCIGTGLIYTLDETSPPAKWIGYQVLAGLAMGSGLPLGIIAGQADAEPEDLPSRTAMLLCKFPFCCCDSCRSPPTRRHRSLTRSLRAPSLLLRWHLDFFGNWAVSLQQPASEQAAFSCPWHRSPRSHQHGCYGHSRCLSCRRRARYHTGISRCHAGRLRRGHSLCRRCGYVRGR